VLIGRGENLSTAFSNNNATSHFNSTQTQYQWQNNFTLPLGTLTAVAERNEQQVNSSTTYTLSNRNVNALQLAYQASIAAHSVQASLRRDNYSDLGGHTTGSLGYGYAINPNWRTTANYGTAFHVPSFNQLFYPNYGNPNLKPEQSEQYDVGVQYHNGTDLVNVTAFENKITDLIVSGPPTYLPNNTAKATIKGLELSGDTLLAGTRIHASVDFQDPKDDATGKTLILRSKQHGTLDLSKEVGQWGFGVQAIASGIRYTNTANTASLGGYTLVNLRTTYQVNKEWRAIAKLNNAFNKDYQTVSGYNTPGANIFVGLEWQQK
jgi:vitamin B12 transporter